MTGVNSSNVVLMDVKSGAVIGDLNGKEQIYPGIHDEDHDCNCGVGSIFRSGS